MEFSCFLALAILTLTFLYLFYLVINISRIQFLFRKCSGVGNKNPQWAWPHTPPGYNGCVINTPRYWFYGTLLQAGFHIHLQAHKKCIGSRIAGRYPAGSRPFRRNKIFSPRAPPSLAYKQIAARRQWCRSLPKQLARGSYNPLHPALQNVWPAAHWQNCYNLCFRACSMLLLIGQTGVGIIWYCILATVGTYSVQRLPCVPITYFCSSA